MPIGTTLETMLDYLRMEVGDSTNPALEFSGVPAGTKSLALLMEDPDVPKNLKPNGVFGPDGQPGVEMRP